MRHNPMTQPGSLLYDLLLDPLESYLLGDRLTDTDLEAGATDAPTVSQRKRGATQTLLTNQNKGPKVRASRQRGT